MFTGTINMASWIVCGICFLAAFIIAVVINPYVIKLAKQYGIVDRPNERKLQTKPVPVIGGICLYFAMTLVALGISIFFDIHDYYILLGGISIIFFIGFLDDLRELGFKLKFLVQIIVVVVLYYAGWYRIDDFCGIFGIYGLPGWVSVVFSIFVGVGLINAVNLIDGVDGLASGLGALINIFCGVYFYVHGSYPMACFAFTIVGAMTPFFVCNVFSKKYKMYLGDSGSLILGTLAYVYTCQVLSTPVTYAIDNYKVAMLMAVFAIPVFDTIRVMLTRILGGKSPFYPDKRHIHHIFVKLGFPHICVTLILLSLSVFVVLCWWGLALCGLGVTLNFCLVVLICGVCVFTPYIVFKLIEIKNRQRFEQIRQKVMRISQPAQKIRLAIRKAIDGSLDIQ